MNPNNVMNKLQHRRIHKEIIHIHDTLNILEVNYNERK